MRRVTGCFSTMQARFGPQNVSALSTLKPVDAAALQLHFGNGFTHEEIGEVMEMSAGAVLKLVARGVEKFRRA